MQLVEHCSLKDKHTFHLDVNCRYWAEATDERDLVSILTDNRFADLPVFLIGAGSNVLFTSNFNGLMLHVGIQGIDIVREDDLSVEVRVGAGVVWDDLVEWAVKHHYSGIENLSGIPGCVGASPVQNIGAYGAEVKDVILEVEVLDRRTHEIKVLNREACQFSYRDSVFKHAFKNTFIVCRVVYRLSKCFHPNLGYGDLEKQVREKGEVTAKTIRDSILSIRELKLPDPDVFGNAGSFFMNPILPSETYNKLKQTYPSIPGWDLGNGQVKVPAAWCIEQAGWKGRELGGAGVHPNQPLVLINKGNATASDLLNLAERITSDVSALLGVTLKPEVLYV